MSKPTFHLQIYTPDRAFYTGEVESLTVPLISGRYGVLFNALPVVSVLVPGMIRFFQNGRWLEAHGKGGVFSVTKEGATILLDDCRWPYEPEQVPADDGQADAHGATETLRAYKVLEAKLAIQFSKIKNRND